MKNSIKINVNCETFKISNVKLWKFQMLNVKLSNFHMLKCETFRISNVKMWKFQMLKWEKFHIFNFGNFAKWDARGNVYSFKVPRFQWLTALWRVAVSRKWQAIVWRELHPQPNPSSRLELELELEWDWNWNWEREWTW